MSSQGTPRSLGLGVQGRTYALVILRVCSLILLGTLLGVGTHFPPLVGNRIAISFFGPERGRKSDLICGVECRVSTLHF